MKSKILLLLGAFCFLFISHVWGGEKYVQGGHLYFDNSQTNWSDVRFATCQDDGNEGKGYLAFNSMTSISNTHLYYLDNSSTKGYAEWTLSGFAFMRDTWDNQDGKWSEKTQYMNDCYSAQKTEYTLNDGSFYYITCAGKGADLGVTYTGTEYSTLNAKQYVKVLLSTDGGAHYYESGTWYGIIKANRWTMNSETTVSNSEKTLSKDDNYASATLTSSITFSVTDPTSGFTFQGWKTASDGEIQSGDLTYDVAGETTIYACFTGSDTDLPKVYFDNTLGWENVWVHFYESAYWNSDKGSGSQSIYHSSIPMTKIDDSNIWYFAYPFDKKSDIIAFTSAEQKDYEFFYDCKAVYKVDFDATKPVFVPCKGISETKNTKDDKHTDYYNKGYWKTLEEPYQYFLKNTWGTESWTWKQMETTDGLTYTLSDVSFTDGNGYDYNFIADDCGKTYITEFNRVGVLETGDKVNITFTPANKEIAATLIPTNQEIAIGATGYATYYYSKPYIIPEGVQAQYVVNVDERALTNEFLDAGDIIPANEGIILHGEKGDYTFIGTTEVPEALEGNMMKGTVATTDVDNDCVHFILSLNSQDKVGLFWPSGTKEGVGSFENGAHKAYLEIPKGSSISLRRIGYAFDQTEETTDVIDVKSGSTVTKLIKNGQLRIFSNGIWYNAQGQKM